jgi:hypothetical protein
VRLWRRRNDSRLRALDEAECYGRAYGERSPDVRTVKLKPRQRFQERLDAREEPEPNV